MFGRQKMYRAGVADAMQANAEFMQKQQAATEHAQHEVNRAIQLTEKTVRTLNGSLDDLRQQLNDKEIEELYKMHLSMDIKQLEECEKHLLVAVLYQLASDRKKNLTEQQRIYLQNIRKYLGIFNPQANVDLNVVSTVDSLEVQKVFWECVLDFFYLQGGNKITRFIRIRKSKRKYLKYFSLNKKQSCAIEERVAHIYEILGPEGIADKYGFVPNTTTADNVGDITPEGDESINEDKETVGKNDPSDSTFSESLQESSPSSQQGVSSQSAGAAKTKQVGKNYGLGPSDVIKFAWMDATFAVERKIAKLNRNRVNRSTDDKTGKKS